MNLADRLRAAAEQPLDLRRDKRLRHHHIDDQEWWSCTRCSKCLHDIESARKHAGEMCGVSR